MMDIPTRLLTTFFVFLFTITLSAESVSLGPERPLTGVREGPAPASLGRQAIATDGVVTYVAWSTGETLGVSEFDRAGIFINTAIVANLEAWQPVIAYDGTSFIVSWTNPTGIYAARLRDLTLDPAAGVKIADPGSRMSIASIGGLTLVAWQQGLSVRAALLDNALHPSKTIEISPNGYMPRVATNGNDFCLTYGIDFDGAGGVEAARVNTSGVVTQRVAIGIRFRPTPDVAASSSAYLIAWPSDSGLNVTSIRYDGTVSEPTSVAGTRSVEFPVIESSGDRISIVWCSDEGGGGIPEMADASSIYFQQFDSGLHSLSAPVCIASSRQGAIGNWIPSIRTDGDNILTTWAEDPSRFGDSVPRYAVLAPDGTPHTRGTLAYAPVEQRRVDIATANSVRLAVWNESSPDGYPTGIAYGRFGEDGRPLDGPGILIGNAAFSSCSVGTDGTDFLLAWMEQDYSIGTGDLYIQRIAHSGEPLGPKSVIGRPLAGAVSVEWSGDNYIVGAGSALYGVTLDGASMGEPLGLTTYPFYGLWSASAGANALFAYGLYSSERYYPTLNVVHADPSGAVGPREIPSQIGGAAVATNGDEFFVPYNDRGSALPHGIRFRMDGSIIGEVVGFAGATAEIFDPRAAAWDGEAFVVLYSTTDWPQTHLVVARVVPGKLWEYLGTVEFESPLTYSAIRLLGGPDGLEIVYGRSVETRRSTVDRLFIRHLETHPGTPVPRRRAIRR